MDQNRDTYVLDLIAGLLGASDSWNGADMLSQIADMIGTVRPHPGNVDAEAYAAIFLATTGRLVPLS